MGSLEGLTRELEMSNPILPARFIACAGLVIERIEGGYVNDPNDPGGETNFGISKRAYPNVDIAGLTEGAALQIYYDDYWVKSGCSALPRGLDLWVFDGAINHGVSEAVKLLQGALKVGVDGVIGPQTEAAAQAWAEPELYLLARLKHYQSLPGWSEDQNGWTLRLFIITRGI
jgi:lysozyme family protein